MRPFEQLDNSYTRSAGGTGLGLSIVRALIGLHGGEMRIASAVEQGTTVIVRLPSAADRGQADDRLRHVLSADRGTTIGSPVPKRA